MVQMGRSAAFALMVLMPRAAHAGDKLLEGRSSACSPRALVCAIGKDGSMKVTDECAALHTNAARILSGDCFDAD